MRLHFPLKQSFGDVQLLIGIPDRWGILTAHRSGFGAKHPVYEQTQAREVETRLRMPQRAQRVSRNVSQAYRFLGISRAQCYIWEKWFEENGPDSLRCRPRRPNMIRYRILPEVIALILRIREERRYGAAHMSLYLQRHDQVYVSPTTILKIFRRHHVGRVSVKRCRPGPKPAQGPLPVPGQSVQLDVKFLLRVGRARLRFCQFTVIDEATRFRVLRVYDHNNTRSAVDFLNQIRRSLPFHMKHMQTDNDSSFGAQFTWLLADLGIAHRRVPSASPEVNGRVERSHKTDEEEFYRGRQFHSRKEPACKLRSWDRKSNKRCPHLAFKGKRPAEQVHELARPFNLSEISLD